jgi:hypothetical protein
VEDVTEDMVRDAYRQGAKARALLVTITSSHLPDPMRFTNWPDGLTQLAGDPDERRFPHVPFLFSFPGASADQPSRDCEIEIGRSGEVALALKSAPKNTVLQVTVEMVRPSAPDIVELAFRNTKARSAGLEGATMKFTLKSRSFQDEFACSKRYVISRTPGLFGSIGAGV